MRKITFLLFALLFSFVGYSQFPTPGTEGFESTTGPDLALPVASSPWTLSTGATGNQWAVFDNGVAGSPQIRWDRSTTNFYNGTQSAYINRKQNGGAGITSDDYLATPLVTVPANGQLTFYTRTGLNSTDTVNYLIKLNTNTAAGSQTTAANYTITAQSWDQTTILYNADSTVWILETVDLSAYAGQQVYIAFVRSFNQPTAQKGGNSWFIDNVKLVQRCLEPTTLSAVATTTTANLSWANPSGSTSWEIEVVPSTSTPTGSGVVYNGTLPYTATGLTPSTSYVYYVRSLCSSSNSNWVGPFNFTTSSPGLTCASPITVSTLPYSTNDSTANYANTYSTAQPTACAGTATNYMAGNDVYYSYTPTTSGNISITMTPGSTRSGIFVYQGCANVGVTCLAGVANTTSNVRSIPSLSVTAGQTYIIVLSSSSSTPTYSYGLVIQQVNCAQPTALAATNITSSSAQLSWTNTTSTSWEYVVQPSGSVIPTGSGTQTSSSTNTLVTGLIGLTAYQYWVRADCGNGTFSAWSGPFLFTTLAAPPVCGGQFVNVQGTTAGTYPANSDSTVIICPTNPGDQVTVTFTSFATETNYDGLYVFDGNTNTSPQIASTNAAGSVPGGVAGSYWGTLTGANLPGPFTASSASGCLTFRFRSDGSVNTGGWVANITCAPAPTCPKPTALATSAVTSNSGTLTWTNNSTATKFEVLALPCGSAAPSASSTGTIITPTGNTYNFSGLTPLTCYTLYVRAICSSTDTSLWSSGVNITTLAAPPVCGGQFVNVQGTTAGTYPASSDSTVIICPTNPGDQVTVTFTSFATESTYDGLYVFDGNSNTAPQIASANPAGNVPGGVAGSYWGTLTGANLPGPFTASSASGCLTFRFRSDGSVSTGGWVANITCAPAPTCSKPINISTGSVTGSSITYNWTQPANPDTSVATSWQVITLPCGSPTPTATNTGWQTVNTNSYTATGLNTSTCYDFYVMAICSASDSSPIKGFLGTSTTCGAQQASSTCDNAPTVCLLNGYCGNTSSQYVPPHTWPALVTAFCGSIENNSFINFQATATSATFNIYVYNSLDSNGVQFFAFDGACNGTTITSHGCTVVAPTGTPGTGTPVSFQMTGLIPGNTYYLMFDGYAGDVCDYQVIPVNGVLTTVDVTPASSSICVGQNVVLTASGGNNVYSWSPSTGLSATTGTSVTASPTVTTTYTVSSSAASTSACSVTKSVTVTVNPLSPAVTDFSYTSPVCSSSTTNPLPIPATGFTSGGTYTSTSGLVLNPTTGEINLATSTPNTYTVTYSVSANPSICRVANSSTATITINPIISPTFAQIVPLCQGVVAPSLPTSSSNTPIAITGNWSPSTIDTVTPGTTTYTFTSAAGQCATPTTLMTITINPGITPLFLEPAPICSGTTAPVLPLSSDNTPPITGTWSPSTVSNTASGTYTFTPNPGQCASSVPLNVTVNTNCAFGAYASAVWLANCSTSNFFNTVGSGADIIGPTANVFPDSNLGTYVQNSSALLLKGAEVKTFKNSASNVCSARLNYRIYPQATTPGAFQIIDLPFFSNCGAGSFINGGGPCNPGDQKWQKVLPNALYPTENPVDLTAYPPGNYTIQVYYDISGSSTTTAGCSETVLMDNNGAYYTASFTIQAQPAYASTNPTTCAGTNGSITISGMAPNTSYGLTYNNGSTTVGPNNVTSDATGSIVINGLSAGTYSNFLVTINGCSYPYNTPIVLVDPTPPSVTVNIPTVCASQPATVTATPTIAGTYSYAWTIPSGTNPGNVATFTTSVLGNYSVIITDTTTLCTSTSASGTVTLSSIIVPTFATIPTVCNGAIAPILSTSSTNSTPITGLWSPATIDTSVAGNTTYTFTPDAGQCSQPISIVVTVTPAITIGTTVTQPPTCALPTGTIQVTPVSSLGTTPTDLFISEVTDSNSGSLSYVELYNGTGSTINLSSYSLKTANNGGAYSFTLPLNNINLATGNTYVIALGDDDACTTPGGDGSLATQTSGSGSVNFSANGNDHFGLFNGTTQIDSWGTFGSGNWAPSSIGTEGADFRRKNTISPLPNTTYNNNDWDIIDYAGSGICANNDYSNIGIYSLTSASNYQYSVDGGTYQSSPTFSGLTPGTHTITVQDTTTGCTSSTTVTLSTPSSTAAVTTFTYTSPVCANVSSTLAPSPGTGFTSGGQYTSTAGLVIDSNTGIVNLATSTPGTYSVTYTVADNSELCLSGNSSSTPLVINVAPTATINNPTVCSGQPATVIATILPTGTYNYIWTNSSGASDPGNVSTFGATISGIYSVIVTDSITGCSSASASGTVTINALPTVTVNNATVCANQLAIVTATPISTTTGTYTYAWTIPSGATPLGNVATFTATASGNYGVTITDSITGCTSLSASSTVLINALPTATVNSPSVCAGQPATVIATVLPTGTYNYVWTNSVGASDPGNVPTFGATISGIYSVIATDAVTGCASSSASGTVTINALPTVTVNSPTACAGQPATVTALPTSTTTGTYTYIWTVPSGATNPGNVTTFNATISGNYGVTITDSITGCNSLSAISTVTINALPTVTVTGDTVCQGSQATISANPSPTTGTYNYVWTGPTTPGNVASFTTSIAGAYSVVITDALTGCTSLSASGTAAFFSSFDFTINGECIDNNFILEVIPTGNTFDLNTSHFDWQYNGVPTGYTDATFNVTNFVHTTTITPTPHLPLTITVNVKTSDNCSQNHDITLDRIYCDIQKGISPSNPDGKNDFFDLRLMNVQTLSIFNRYGTKVYSKGDYINEWVGQTDSGSELPDGTYYYVIEFKNDQPTKTGWIYINRQNK